VRQIDWRQRIRHALEERPGAYRSEAGEWMVEFVSPDRFRLRHLEEEWIDIGGRHYAFAGFWADTTAVPEARRRLELERWLRLLREEEPQAVRFSEGMLELVYRGDNRIWLDADDRIVKAKSALLEQTFSYDDDISIEAPVDPNAFPAALLD
jgi:hypothetical protein